ARTGTTGWDPGTPGGGGVGNGVCAIALQTKYCGGTDFRVSRNGGADLSASVPQRRGLVNSNRWKSPNPASAVCFARRVKSPSHESERFFPRRIPQSSQFNFRYRDRLSGTDGLVADSAGHLWRRGFAKAANRAARAGDGARITQSSWSG